MSKTINEKQTMYASMRTERSPLTLLICFLALATICGFIVTPIAGAELDNTGGAGGDVEKAYLQGIRYAVRDSVNEIDKYGYTDEALHAFRITECDRADTRLRDVIAFCAVYNVQSRLHIGTDDNIYCWMTLYYPQDHTWERCDHLLNEDEKVQACSMIQDELNAKGLRYHPEPKAGYHDPFIYHAEIGNVTFHFTIMWSDLWFDLDDPGHDLYLWFTPESKDRQDNRRLNTVFKFDADTKDLVVYNPEILEDDILSQNSMMLNLEGYNIDYIASPCYERHRHAIYAGQEHNITVS